VPERPTPLFVGRTLEPLDDLEPRGDYDGRSADHADFSGQDGRGSMFTECLFDGALLHDSRLDGARFVDCRFTGIQATALQLARSAFTDVVVRESRLGGVVAYEVVWQRVPISGGKLDFVNLRGSKLSDVTITDAALGEIDLGGATVKRLRILDCRIDQLTVPGAKLSDVDISTSAVTTVAGLDSLRGTTISEAQLHGLAPALAAHLGIIVAPPPTEAWPGRARVWSVALLPCPHRRLR